VSGPEVDHDRARHDELLAELRHLRNRLDALESERRPSEPAPG
jgi:hypothetical protein